MFIGFAYGIFMENLVTAVKSLQKLLSNAELTRYQKASQHVLPNELHLLKQCTQSTFASIASNLFSLSWY